MNRRLCNLALAPFLVAPLLLAISAGGAVAEEHGHWGGHGGGGRGGEWHGSGQINHFHERDLGHWQGGGWQHGWHGGRSGWWWVVGGAWYWYPAPVYPYPDPYLPPLVAAPPAAGQYWYYCPNPPGYYPYVPACAAPWQLVPATPAPPPQ